VLHKASIKVPALHTSWLEYQAVVLQHLTVPRVTHPPPPSLDWVDMSPSSSCPVSCRSFVMSAFSCSPNTCVVHKHGGQAVCESEADNCIKALSMCTHLLDRRVRDGMPCAGNSWTV
jgi:hypothetical protein